MGKLWREAKPYANCFLLASGDQTMDMDVTWSKQWNSRDRRSKQVFDSGRKWPGRAESQRFWPKKYPTVFRMSVLLKNGEKRQVWRLRTRAGIVPQEKLKANLGKENADSFHRDLHPDLKADYILANPPFNSSDWGGERLREDKRWVYGVPPTGNANFAWVQNFIYHLAPNGVAGFVLANGSLSSNQSGEGEIRKNMVEADVVDCIVALPGQLFYSTPIPVSLWFVSRNKKNGKGLEGKLLRDRSGEILLIDARKLGFMSDRTHRDLSDADIARIVDAYHNWRGDGPGTYEDIQGFCKSAKLEEVRSHGHVLTPGRYVGAKEAPDDGKTFEEKMKRLTAQLNEQFKESARLEQEIRSNLSKLGYGL